MLISNQSGNVNVQNLLTTSFVYGNDFRVLEILYEDGECYIS